MSSETPQRAEPRVIRVAEATRDRAVAEAAHVVAAGGVIAFPTETVYGVGASAESGAAPARLFELKGRDRSKPIALLLSRFELAEQFALAIPPTARRLADAFCPGPITLVLSGREEATVGIRVPDHDLALALIEACGGALYAPSANASGQPPARSVDEVRSAFPSGLDLVLDGGVVALGTPSTVIQVDGDAYRILRLGAIGEREIEDVVQGRCCSPANGKGPEHA